MKRLAKLTCLLLVLAAPLTNWAADAPASSANAVQQLLALELPDEQGKKFAFKQWQGRVLVINFWATWCAPCKAEIPEFSRLNTAWQKKSVQFVGIAIDKRENVQAFVDKIKVSYPQLIDNGQMMQQLRALGNEMQGLPFTLVIDGKGEVLARRLGEFETKELEALLKTATTPPDQAKSGKK